LIWTGRGLPVGLSGVLFGGGCAAIAAWDIVQPSILRARRSAFVNRDNQTRTLVVKSDIAKFLFYALGCAGFTSVGVLMILMEKDVWVGYLTAGFFGPGTMLLLWQIIDRRPRLVIDSDGVIDRTLGIGLIVWDDIESANLYSAGEHDFIGLVVRDPQKYMDRMSWLRRKMTNLNSAFGFNGINLNLTGITITSEEVLVLVNWHLLRNQINREESEPKSYGTMKE
jgi:hypothetical protein